MLTPRGPELNWEPREAVLAHRRLQMLWPAHALASSAAATAAKRQSVPGPRYLVMRHETSGQRSQPHSSRDLGEIRDPRKTEQLCIVYIENSRIILIWGNTWFYVGNFPSLLRFKRKGLDELTLKWLWLKDLTISSIRWCTLYSYEQWNMKLVLSLSGSRFHCWW